MSQRTLTDKIPPKTLQVLIADDDVEAIVPLRIALQNFDFKVTTAFDGPEALKLMAHKYFDLVFLDMNMPGLTGGEVLARVDTLQQQVPWRKQYPVQPVITYSSVAEEDLKLPEGEGFYVVGHWQKPLLRPQLIHHIAEAMDRLHLHSTFTNQGDIYESKYR